MNRSITIILEECSKECPYFEAYPGLGHCEDSRFCSLSHKEIHDGHDDYCGPFPKFCKLGKTNKKATPRRYEDEENRLASDHRGGRSGLD